MVTSDDLDMPTMGICIERIFMLLRACTNFCFVIMPPVASVTARKSHGATHVCRILISFTITECLEQRYSNKFCQELGELKKKPRQGITFRTRQMA